MAEKLQFIVEVKDDGTPVIKKFTDEAKKAYKEMTDGPNQVKGAFSGMKDSWIGLTAGVAAFSTAALGAAGMIKAFVDEAAEAEQIENRLRFALESVGYQWSIAKSYVDEFASSIQAATRFSDEQARQALTDLMLYTDDFSKAQMGAKLAMDMSIRTGQDLHSTSRLIGMAMSGNVEMLGRYLPELRNLDNVLGKNATQAEKAEHALKILQQKFAGTAQADLNSYAGVLAQFKNSWSDLKETLGMYLLPTLKEVFTWFKKLIDIANEWAGQGRPETVAIRLKIDLSDAERQISVYEGYLKRAETAAPGTPFKLGPEATEDAKKRLSELKDWADYLRKQMKIEEESLKAGMPIKKDIYPEVKKEIDIVKEVQAAIEAVTYAEEQRGILAMARHELAESGWAKEKDIVKEINDEIARLDRETNQWGEVTVARQELAETGWTKQEDIIKEVRAEIERLEREANQWGEVTVARQELAETGWKAQDEKLKETRALWEDLGKNMLDTWQHHLSGILKGAQSLKQGLGNIFKGMADLFISEVTRMAFKWLFFEETWKGGVKQSSFLGGGSPIGAVIGWIGSAIGLQEGGIVTKPTPAIVGEAGPEAVVPLKGGKIPIEGIPKGNNYTYMIINCVDSQSFEDRFGDSVIKIVSTDKKLAGPLSFE